MLTSRSLDLLAIEDGAEVAHRQEQFARANCADPLVQQTSITCMVGLALFTTLFCSRPGVTTKTPTDDSQHGQM